MNSFSSPEYLYKDKAQYYFREYERLYLAMKYTQIPEVLALLEELEDE
jgi:hypothetical protein